VHLGACYINIIYNNCNEDTCVFAIYVRVSVLMLAQTIQGKGILVSFDAGGLTLYNLNAD
jgi:hypothetical protein